MSMSASTVATLAQSYVGQGPQKSFWFPPSASNLAPAHDFVFNYILYTSTIFYVLIVIALVVFIWKYRRKEGVGVTSRATHHTVLEIVWSVIPAILLALMFWFGAGSYIKMRTPADDALEVLVTGQKWSWAFTYPNGYTDPELHVPVNKPVRLVMTSEDVIHSLYIPAMRVKLDVVPGRYTKIGFTPTQAGLFQIFCTEYCGTKHSEMLSRLVVHLDGGYEQWISEKADVTDKLPPVEAGKVLTQRNGCIACHSLDGKPGVGPSWKGVFGATGAMTDGSQVTKDENYIRESILEPTAKVAAGFPPAMPTYKGRIKDKEITAIIEYLKTLK